MKSGLLYKIIAKLSIAYPLKERACLRHRRLTRSTSTEQVLRLLSGDLADDGGDSDKYSDNRAKSSSCCYSL